MNEKAIMAAAEAIEAVHGDYKPTAEDYRRMARRSLTAAQASFPGDIVEIEVPTRSSTSKDGIRYRGVLVAS